MLEILVIVILFLSIVFHEYAHGWVAHKLGDATPKLSGRLTLNPFAHIDTFGTVILPLLLLIVSEGRFAIGYAKPVPINPYNFKNPKKGIMWVGIAGPLTNITLATAFIFLTKIFTMLNIITSQSIIYAIFSYGIFINLILAIFNILPIPPLDGSKVVTTFLPYKQARSYLRMEMIGFILIISLILLGFLHWFIFPIVKFIFSLVNINIPFIV